MLHRHRNQDPVGRLYGMRRTHPSQHLHSRSNIGAEVAVPQGGPPCTARIRPDFFSFCSISQLSGFLRSRDMTGVFFLCWLCLWSIATTSARPIFLISAVRPPDPAHNSTTTHLFFATPASLPFTALLEPHGNLNACANRAAAGSLLSFFALTHSSAEPKFRSFPD